jgi:uncharacterized linocin/CFP29 family protein
MIPPGFGFRLFRSLPPARTAERGVALPLRLRRDISIGHEQDDTQTVDLYLSESFSFRVVTPEAAVALAP